MNGRIRVAALLIDLEGALRSRLLWDADEPSPEALASTQPFCIDTLDFPQWLQFVFLPRMRALRVVLLACAAFAGPDLSGHCPADAGPTGRARSCTPPRDRKCAARSGTRW